VANPRASKRATKNPKNVRNPKYRPRTTTSARAPATTSKVPTKAGNPLTDYNDGQRESFSSCLGPSGREGVRRLTCLQHLCSLVAVWAGTVLIGTPPVAYIIDFDTGYVAFCAREPDCATHLDPPRLRRSSDLWIPSVNCTAAACNTHTKYNPAKSSTSTSVPGSRLSITYGDGSSTTGSVWKDTVTGEFGPFVRIFPPKHRTDRVAVIQ
jgi:hypothetical protein